MVPRVLIQPSWNRVVMIIAHCAHVFQKTPYGAKAHGQHGQHQCIGSTQRPCTHLFQSLQLCQGPHDQHDDQPSMQVAGKQRALAPHAGCNLLDRLWQTNIGGQLMWN